MINNLRSRVVRKENNSKVNYNLRVVRENFEVV